MLFTTARAQTESTSNPTHPVMSASKGAENIGLRTEAAFVHQFRGLPNKSGDLSHETYGSIIRVCCTIGCAGVASCAKRKPRREQRSNPRPELRQRRCRKYPLGRLSGVGAEGFWGHIGLRAEVGDEIYFSGGPKNNLKISLGLQFRFWAKLDHRR
jgi:hypothetical protein